MLLIVLIMLSIAAFAVPLYLIATTKVFLKFRGLKEKSYHEIIWLYIFTALKKEKNAVQELRRYDKTV